MKREIPVGIMHGRLLPPFEGRFQTFPAARWRDEFAYAREAGLASIEWIYETYHEAENPLGSDAGIAEIHTLSAESGVQVRSICADYYMQALLVSSGKIEKKQADHLHWLLGRAALLGAIYMILPFVDQSAIRTPADRRALGELLADVLPHAEQLGMEIHLETDFPPDVFAALLTGFAHPSLKANYDIGNSASLGFDPEVELRVLRPWLGSVHVKDRVLGGGTVPLGTGNAKLESCFRLIVEAGYDRPFIMQVARGVEGDEVAWAKKNRMFIERSLMALDA